MNRLAQLDTCLVNRSAVFLDKAVRLKFDPSKLSLTLALNRYLQHDFSDAALYFTVLDSKQKPTFFHSIEPLAIDATKDNESPFYDVQDIEFLSTDFGDDEDE